MIGQVEDKSVLEKLENLSQNLFDSFPNDSSDTVCTLLKNVLKERCKQVADMDVRTAVENLWYIIGGIEPTAQSNSKIGKYIRGGDTFVKRIQKCLWERQIWRRYKLKNSFVFRRANESDREMFRVGKVLLILYSGTEV